MKVVEAVLAIGADDELQREAGLWMRLQAALAPRAYRSRNVATVVANATHFGGSINTRGGGAQGCPNTCCKAPVSKSRA
eukprot:9478864-Pyramimonas_sp.AAC.1